jgi:hypothetical protein
MKFPGGMNHIPGSGRQKQNKRTKKSPATGKGCQRFSFGKTAPCGYPVKGPAVRGHGGLREVSYPARIFSRYYGR